MREIGGEPLLVDFGRPGQSRKQGLDLGGKDQLLFVEPIIKWQDPEAVTVKPDRAFVTVVYGEGELSG